MLSTDYMDDIFSGSRKYLQVENDDGTVSFEDKTEYTQEGSAIGASVLNAICKSINRINSTVTMTLSADGWTEVSDGYTQSLSPTLPNDDEYDADATPLWYLNSSATDDLVEAFSYIGSCEETSSGFTFKCGTDKPGIDVPIKVKGY